MQNSQESLIRIITPPSKFNNSDYNIVAVDLNDQQQKQLLELTLDLGNTVNIWSWNTGLYAPQYEWLKEAVDSADLVVARYSVTNPLASYIIDQSKTFYLIDETSVNILESVSKHPLTDIKDLPLYGDR